MAKPDLLSQVKKQLATRGAKPDEGADHVMAVRLMNAFPLEQKLAGIYVHGAAKLLGSHVAFLSANASATPGKTFMAIRRTAPDISETEISLVPLTQAFQALSRRQLMQDIYRAGERISVPLHPEATLEVTESFRPAA